MDDFIYVSDRYGSGGFFDFGKEKLCFDDGSIGPLTGQSRERTEPSPASALEQWERGVRSRGCARTVAAILVRNLDYLNRVERDPVLEQYVRKTLRYARAAGKYDKVSGCFEILGEFSSAMGKLKKAEKLYLKSFDAQLSMEKVDQRRLASSLKRYEKFLSSAGRSDDFPAIRSNWGIKASLKNGEFVRCRSLALEAYKAGEYETAEEAYEALIKEGFSIASMYCHLVRLRITVGRFAEAEKALRQAVSASDGCESYIAARIHFFKVVFLFLEGSSARSELIKLNAILKDARAYLFWEIEDMLRRLESRVSEKRFKLLCSLGTALQSSSDRAVLDENLLWRVSVSEGGRGGGAKSDLHAKRWRIEF